MESLHPVLPVLGYHDLPEAALALSVSLNLFAWLDPNTPVTAITFFAPSADSARACSAPTCSLLRLLHDHMAPALYSHRYLAHLPSGFKIQTTIPNRCLTLTANVSLDGVQIARPDLYNHTRLIIHGLESFIPERSPFSCLPNRPMDSAVSQISTVPVPLHLTDAISRLDRAGYTILAYIMAGQFYAKLKAVPAMTVFAIDDAAILSGDYSYVSTFPFHVVPERILMLDDLVKLPVGTCLPTLVHGHHLVVTQHEYGIAADLMPGSVIRINSVKIKTVNVISNDKIVIHRITMPFPRLSDEAMEEVVPGGCLLKVGHGTNAELRDADL